MTTGRINQVASNRRPPRIRHHGRMRTETCTARLQLTCSVLQRGKSERRTTGNAPRCSAHQRSTQSRRTTNRIDLGILPPTLRPPISTVSQHDDETFVLAEAHTFCRLGRHPSRSQSSHCNIERLLSERPQVSSDRRTRLLRPCNVCMHPQRPPRGSH